MMSYVAFLRNPRAPLANETASAFRKIFAREFSDWSSIEYPSGLTLFHSSCPGRHSDATILPSGLGVILGTLFTQSLFGGYDQAHPTIDEKTARRIVQTQGEYLTKEYWGSYAAFLCDDDRGAHYVMRDCSGGMPCYTLSHQEVTIVTSNINHLRCLALPAFSINKEYLAGFFMEAELAHSSCALREVEEILAGECLLLNNGSSRRFTLWDPRRICTEDVIEDFDEATNRVRQVAQACVDLWGSRFDRIVLLLSGGLDSSVILACLRESANRPSITCVHRAYGGRDSNELEFARLAAGEFDLTIQWDYNDNLRYDERILVTPKSPKPSVAGLALAMESDVRNLIPEKTKAQAVWDGQGGDHLFLDSRAPFEAVDYAFTHGITRDFALHVQGAARQSRLSYWGVIGQALKFGIFRSAWHPGAQHRQTALFLNPEISQPLNHDYVWQPWLSDSRSIPPGKRFQIGILAWLLHRHRPIPELEYAPGYHPLFSQPLLELCLRIPVFTLLRGGINRSLERAAFRDCVPQRILRREHKGSTTISHMDQIRASMPFVRDLILDGVLVKENIADRAALEPYLIGNRPLDHKSLWPFLSCLAAEVWARNWAESGWRV